MKIFNVLPRNMRFEADRATSIDLCVSEIACASRYASSTTVLAEAGERPLPAPGLIRLHKRRHGATLLRILEVVAHARRLRPDVIVVQQHIPTAAGVATLLRDVPVILQTHNLPKPRPCKGLLQSLHQRRREAMLRSLAGITFVSEASASLFRENWPDIDLPAAVVPNGFDPAAWSARPRREQEVICVGRAVPEKGLLEAAYAVAAVLLGHEGWRTTFVISEPGACPGEAQRIAQALSPLGRRARLLVNRPYPEVRALNETAAIALVPSKWQEPFGRTALEAHFGGAALISSGTGGLREVSGDAAYYLPDVSVSSIAHALDRMIPDAARRAALAQAGRERALALYSVASVAERLDQFCARVHSLSLPRGVIAQAIRT